MPDWSDTQMTIMMHEKYLLAGIENSMFARGHAVAEEVVVGLEAGGDGVSRPVGCPPVFRHDVDEEIADILARVVSGGEDFQFSCKQNKMNIETYL
jgi:hypothetical protein